jgi:hypothetical protein
VNEFNKPKLYSLLTSETLVGADRRCNSWFSIGRKGRKRKSEIRDFPFKNETKSIRV